MFQMGTRSRSTSAKRMERDLDFDVADVYRVRPGRGLAPEFPIRTMPPPPATPSPGTPVFGLEEKSFEEIRGVRPGETGGFLESPMFSVSGINVLIDAIHYDFKVT
jgi:hypothetical protein